MSYIYIYIYVYIYIYIYTYIYIYIYWKMLGSAASNENGVKHEEAFVPLISRRVRNISKSD